MSTFKYTDRYGGNWPDPKTVCPGDCEGMGCIPVHKEEDDPVLLKLWQAAERLKPSDDGYHFVKCPTCNGTGKRP